MTVDPFRLAIAVIPVAAYVLLLGLLNLRRRPFLTSGGCDLAALGVALSGLMFVGPLELFRPDAATQSFGNYIWLFLVLFYWLCLVLVVLLARPRLVIYNISAEELHPVLAETASRLDPTGRWAGNNLSLPSLGVQLHLDSLDVMRNVSLVASGGRQNLDGWRRLARELGRSLSSVRAKPNPRAVGLLVLSLALFTICLTRLLLHPAEVMQAMNDVFAF
jgi:hypothetical protein